jgi:organic radical activating enzyme
MRNSVAVDHAEHFLHPSGSPEILIHFLFKPLPTWQVPMSIDFDIDAFYGLATSSSKVNPGPVLTYIRSFEKVILWGAANFGAQVGDYLLKQGIAIKNYWDIRAADLCDVNGIQVIQPFSSDTSKDQTLVILCITNNVIKTALWNRLRQEGYTNVLKGDLFFMGAICPFDDHTGVHASVCVDPLACRFVCCERLSSIVAKKSINSAKVPKPGEPIHLIYACILVNSVCTLDCKYCVQYINNYPKHLQKNVPTQRVCDDIRALLGAVDSIGGVSLMGGETFLHQDIHLIASALSEQENFGLASFPTCGIVRLDPKKLESFRDKRLSINFGNYTRVLNDRQKELFWTNVELVKSMGLSYTVGNPMFEWIKPSTMYDLGNTEAEMRDKKQSCAMPPRNLQAKNGKLHPCDLGAALNNIGIVDTPEDYVDLAGTPDLMELREKIRAFIDAPFYRTCGHCNSYPSTCEAMVQGFHDYTKPSAEY